MNRKVYKITLAAMFLALGIIFPMAFHAFGPNAGSSFLPMHIPVLLCGFLCGPFYGAMVGVLTPLLSSMLTGMPMLMPIGIAMMFELCVYGIVSGVLVKRYNVYMSLVVAMLAGRVVSGVVNLVLMGFMGKAYTLSIFVSAAFITAIPGIILQLFAIPILVNVAKKLNKTKQN